MALINIAAREIHCKVVYYGPSMSGKTANLTYIHHRIPIAANNKLLSINIGIEHTLFFDYLPADMGKANDFQTRFHLYTVPGQPLYGRSRVALLNGVDGIVFVADSQHHRLESNIVSMDELAHKLAQIEKTLQDVPIVLQYNKRDLTNVLPVEELDKQLNPHGRLRFEASATSGAGVSDTLKGISKLVLGKL